MPPTTFRVIGYRGCANTGRATTVCDALRALFGSTVTLDIFEDEAAYHAFAERASLPGGGSKLAKLQCPLVYVTEAGAEAGAAARLLGDFAGFAAYVRSTFGIDAGGGAGPDATSDATLIFVGGDRSQVGKSSVCLALLGALLRLGYAPSELAYIKPATQCESAQLVTRFAAHAGVAHRGIGPVVFYSGFTREFLKGNTAPSSELLAQCAGAVADIARGKKVVVVDGVGYPAVGSICGVSNAAVAAACGAPVLLVGKKGVGDAVDSFNLNAAFFERHGATVLGAVFNRLPREGYYSLANCKAAVDSYFAQFRPAQAVYGYVPQLEQLAGASEAPKPASSATGAAAGTAAGGAGANNAATEADLATVELLVDAFMEHVDVKRIVADAAAAASGARRGAPAAAAAGFPPPAAPAPAKGSSSSRLRGGAALRSRADIEAAARTQGASGG